MIRRAHAVASKGDVRVNCYILNPVTSYDIFHFVERQRLDRANLLKLHCESGLEPTVLAGL